MEPVTTAVVLAGVGNVLKPLLDRMFGPAANEVGAHFGAKMRSYLESNRDAVLGLAAEKAASSGKDVHEIPMRTAIPLLEGASRENHPHLQSMWANLIASAATSNEEDAVPPLYASTLAQLTPRSAEFLVTLATLAQYNRALSLSRTKVLTGEAPMRFGIPLEEVGEHLSLERDQAYLIADILTRQALIEREGAVARYGRKADIISLTDEKDWAPTTFGWSFIEACDPSAPDHPSDDASQDEKSPD